MLQCYRASQTFVFHASLIAPQVCCQRHAESSGKNLCCLQCWLQSSWESSGEALPESCNLLLKKSNSLVKLVTPTSARLLCIQSQHVLALCYPSEGLLGELMIRSLKMLVLPLVAGCMVASVCALGEAGSGMGRTAAWTLGIFFATTCIAAMLGVTLAAAFHPGHAGDLSSQGMPAGTHTGKIFVLLVPAAPPALNHATVSHVCPSITQHLLVNLCSHKRALCCLVQVSNTSKPHKHCPPYGVQAS